MKARKNRAVAVLMSAMLAASVVGATSVPVMAAKTYQNCTKLNQDYPHGVGKSGARDKVDGKYRPGRSVTNFKVSRSLYNANAGKDRDGDNIACEKK